MKKLITGLFILTIFSLTSCAAQSQVKTEKNNYVVLTKKVPQLKPILLAAEELVKEDAENFGDFQIIVCGKTVEDLTDAAAMEGFLDQAGKLGIKINACGFSLNKFNVNAEELPEGINVVKNGILYDLQLQKKNYLSVEL
jgi:intracellular sulfur oxidation DsrE/DsrF family protein